MASEVSSIKSCSKVRSQKRANNLYSLIDKRGIKGKKREERQRGEEGKSVVLREDKG